MEREPQRQCWPSSQKCPGMALILRTNQKGPGEPGSWSCQGDRCWTSAANHHSPWLAPGSSASSACPSILWYPLQLPAKTWRLHTGTHGLSSSRWRETAHHQTVMRKSLKPWVLLSVTVKRKHLLFCSSGLCPLSRARIKHVCLFNRDWQGRAQSLWTC